MYLTIDGSNAELKITIFTMHYNILCKVHKCLRYMHGVWSQSSHGASVNRDAIFLIKGSLNPADDLKMTITTLINNLWCVFLILRYICCCYVVMYHLASAVTLPLLTSTGVKPCPAYPAGPVTIVIFWMCKNCQGFTMIIKLHTTPLFFSSISRSVLYQIDTSLPGIPPIPFKIELPTILKIRQVSGIYSNKNFYKSGNRPHPLRYFLSFLYFINMSYFSKINFMVY